jgi:predicted RNase H-like HicB family nuclease
MTKKPFDRIVRPATPEERQRHAEIREKAMQEFPPAENAVRSTKGITRRLSMPTEKKKRRNPAGKTLTYTAYFLPDEEAGGYTAHIPALGIVTEGESLAEARTMARDAIEGRIAVLRELNQPIPKDVEPEQVEVKV